MSEKLPRILVVGVSSLLGREIAEVLQDSPLAAANVVLLDNDVEPGKLEEVNGEAVVLQAIEPAAFQGADVVIFATAADTGRYWEEALRAGAAAVDATGAVQGLTVLSPRLGNAAPLLLDQNGVAAAHPVATMLAACLGPLHERGLLQVAYATVLQPASENGAAALDEMHQQAVSLLSFQNMPNEQHDIQVAFNLLRRLGEDAKIDLETTAKVVERQLQSLLTGPPLPVLQWLQAPVFHGYGISLFLVTRGAAETDTIAEVFSGTLMEQATPDDVPVSNVSAAGQDRILFEMSAPVGNVLRLWIVADNLRLFAQTAVGCAVELLRLRPTGVVQ